MMKLTQFVAALALGGALLVPAAEASAKPRRGKKAQAHIQVGPHGVDIDIRAGKRYGYDGPRYSKRGHRDYRRGKGHSYRNGWYDGRRAKKAYRKGWRHGRGWNAPARRWAPPPRYYRSRAYCPPPRPYCPPPRRSCD